MKRYQFRLRTLMLAWTVTCVFTVTYVESVRQQRLAVQEISANGGSVDYKYVGLGLDYFEKTFGKDWFGTVVGVHCFRDHGSSQIAAAAETHPYVTSLGLSGEEVSNHTILQFADLPGISRLKLINTGITDEGARSIVSMETLETLEIENAEITNTLLQFLGDLSNLTYLNLKNCKISRDAALEFGKSHSQCTIVLDDEHLQEGRFHL